MNTKENKDKDKDKDNNEEEMLLKLKNETFFDYLDDMKPSVYNILSGGENASIILEIKSNNTQKKDDIFDEPWSNQAHEIIPGLYLGDYDAATNIRFVKEAKIQGIVNLAAGLENKFDRKSKTPFINYLEDVQIYDNPNEDIIAASIKSIPFIHQHLSQNKNVLVHCAAGISRSVSIVCAYLMFLNKWNFFDALDYVQQKRPSSLSPNPNVGFRRQLLSLNNEERIHNIELTYDSATLDDASPSATPVDDEQWNIPHRMYPVDHVPRPWKTDDYDE
jgi:protein-tyrosine phosphatase